MQNYAGNSSTFPATTLIMEGSDPRTSSVFGACLEGLGDRTAYCKAVLDSHTSTLSSHGTLISNLQSQQNFHSGVGTASGAGWAYIVPATEFTSSSGTTKFSNYVNLAGPTVVTGTLSVQCPIQQRTATFTGAASVDISGYDTILLDNHSASTDWTLTIHGGQTGQHVKVCAISTRGNTHKAYIAPDSGLGCVMYIPYQSASASNWGFNCQMGSTWAGEILCDGTGGFRFISLSVMDQ